MKLIEKSNNFFNKIFVLEKKKMLKINRFGKIRREITHWKN